MLFSFIMLKANLSQHHEGKICMSQVAHARDHS
jgi:hypothetical protein